MPALHIFQEITNKKQYISFHEELRFLSEALYEKDNVANRKKSKLSRNNCSEYTQKRITEVICLLKNFKDFHRWVVNIGAYMKIPMNEWHDQDNFCSCKPFICHLFDLKI